MPEEGLLTAEFKRKFGISFALFTGVLALGTFGYRMLSGGQSSYLDCLYMTVITLATVGYGEVVDLSHSPAGRAFTIGLIFTGMGIILYFITAVTTFLVDGSINELFRRKRMRKTIERLSGHYIVCGAGTMGLHVLEELHRTGHGAVVIDMDPALALSLPEAYPGVGVITGDATENEVLDEAGIMRASGIVVATNNDKDNLVITLTARQMRPELRIVSRCARVAHKEKLLRAGANAVVPLNYIGGLRMASEMIRPSVVNFLDSMLRDRERDLRIEEINVSAGSGLDGAPVSRVREAVLVLALLLPGGEYVFNPENDFRLGPGMSVIFMGAAADRKRAEALM